MTARQGRRPGVGVGPQAIEKCRKEAVVASTK